MLAQPEAGSAWQARLALTAAPCHGRTVLTRRQRSGPLAVQKVLYPEGTTGHVYLLHPPGGLVGGDTLHFDIEAAPGAELLLTTPASGKVYRSDGRCARQTADLAVADGSSLEWLPQDNILFDSSRFEGRTRITLGRAARYIGREQLTLGRPAHGDRFSDGATDQHTTVILDGAPLLEERLRFAAPSPFMRVPWGLGGRSVLGTLFAYPADDDTLALARKVGHDEDTEAAATRLDALLCLRCLGHDATRVREYLARVWEALRPDVIGRAPCVPRVWAT